MSSEFRVQKKVGSERGKRKRWESQDKKKGLGVYWFRSLAEGKKYEGREKK